MANRLNGKVAIVTGAASGMGKAIALDFLREGGKVLAADINNNRLAELTEEVSAEGFADNLKTCICNITKSEDCENALKTCIETFGICNVLSHNAGIADDFSPVGEIKDENWEKLININLTGAMKITRACIPYFLTLEEDEDTGQKASIVMITSNAAFESATGGPAYCASKAGANALMKAIAFEYYRDGVRCNSICPGPILTNITDSAPMENNNENGRTIHCGSGYNDCSWKWTGGILGMPEQVSPLAVYLASDESVFMNGNSCVIDSGVCLSR